MTTYTFAQFKLLHPSEIRQILMCPIASMTSKKGFRDYEQNWEFEDMVLTLEDGTVITEVAGYNAINEMLSYDKLTARNRLEISSQFAGWLQYVILEERMDNEDPAVKGVFALDDLDWEPTYPTCRVRAAARETAATEVARYVTELVRERQSDNCVSDAVQTEIIRCTLDSSFIDEVKEQLGQIG